MTTGGPVDYETLLLEVRDGVAHLTLNRPDSANGINVTMARELEQAGSCCPATRPCARCC